MGGETTVLRSVPDIWIRVAARLQGAFCGQLHMGARHPCSICDTGADEAVHGYHLVVVQALTSLAVGPNSRAGYTTRGISAALMSPLPPANFLR